jgi:hypothetical protein
MFKFLFKKERQVQELIFSYLDNLKKTQEHFEQAMDCYFDFGLGENCDFLIAQTHKFESRADDSDFSSQSTLFPIISKQFSSRSKVKR